MTEKTNQEGNGQYLAKIKGWFQSLKNSIGGERADGSERKILSLGVSKQGYYIALSIFVISILIFCGVAGWLFYKYNSTNARLDSLKELGSYNLDFWEKSDYFYMKKNIDNKGGLLAPNTGDIVLAVPKTIDDLRNVYDGVKQENTKYKEELDFKKSVYSKFLKNFLLPSLNIWKHPYTQEVDLSIIGKRYLDQNPYQDISLISQWSSIIRDSGKGEGINEVMNINIGDIQESEDQLFQIPIDISFKSDSKRAFLFLVDKLSLTSNISNIGLLNDLTYTLFEEITSSKSEEIEKLKEIYTHFDPKTMTEGIYKNSLIAHYLYETINGRVVEEKTSKEGEEKKIITLIDDKLIGRVIRTNAVCWKSKEELEKDGLTKEEIEKKELECYFRFRNKYRTIPTLAYSIGMKKVENKQKILIDFYKSIPPLIAIQSFNFDKAKNQGFSIMNKNEYVGNIKFNIYGRSISPKELEEVSSLLTVACYWPKGVEAGDKESLEAPTILKKIEEAITHIGTEEKVKVERMRNLLELRDIFTEEVETYPNLNTYEKVIKKFEYQRMLNDFGLCSSNRVI